VLAGLKELDLPVQPRFARAVSILRRYNTRLYPRLRETSAQAIFSRVLRAWGCPVSQAALQVAIERFFGYFAREAEARPDALIALKQLACRGIRYGVLSNVPYGMPHESVLRDLDRCGLLSRLPLVLTSVRCGWRKPHPRPYRQLAQALGVKVQELVFVGDERVDVEGAFRAGARPVLLARRRGMMDGLPEGTAVITGLDQLAHLIQAFEIAREKTDAGSEMVV